MLRSICGGLALAVCSLSVLSGAPRQQDDVSTLPMRFAAYQEGPADSCGSNCRLLVSALGMTTTVGRIREQVGREAGNRRVAVLPRAECQSMCPFVLLGGVRRFVPPEARVLVHQIWLGDRRDDAAAANYSAEDLVLVQRDIGKLVQYTVEMGGGAELLEVALRIPPWEPMRMLSRDELRRTRLDTGPDRVGQAPAAAVTPV